MLVEHGARLDMTINSGIQAFSTLMKFKSGCVVLSQIIRENAFKCFERSQVDISYDDINWYGDIKMIRLCHAAGFPFSKTMITAVSEKVQELKKELEAVPKLTSLCRIVIRSRMASPLSTIVHRLGLPGVMNEYLTFSEDTWFK